MGARIGELLRRIRLKELKEIVEEDWEEECYVKAAHSAVVILLFSLFVLLPAFLYESSEALKERGVIRQN